MKKVLLSILFIYVLSGCSTSKKTQSGNSKQGIIFYQKNSHFFVFYATDKRNLSRKQLVNLMDNQYGYYVWFSKSKYQFSLEDLLPFFDTLNYKINDSPIQDNYIYAKAFLNKRIESKLVDSIYRKKDVHYKDLSFDQFLIGKLDLIADSLIFLNPNANSEYIRLLDLHKGSINAVDPPPPPKSN